MRPALERWLALWGELDMKRRVQLVVVTLLTIGVLVTVGVWSATPAWRPLLEGRAYDELLDAAASLSDQGIRYRIKDGSLQVPAGELGAGKAALATMSDLPGLADVGDLQLGLTPAAQEWAFLRAREGDLSRVINAIDGIAASRVNLVPSKESLFLDEAQPARASVFVRLRPGRSIGDTQVRAITNLVAGAVEDLTADRVAVVDDRGNLLAEGAGPRANTSDVPNELLAYRSDLERHYERAVSQALLPVVGFDGGFSVTASVDIDLTSTETVTKRMDTKTQALMSEQIDESNSEREAPGGVPGVDANLPERPAQGAQGKTREEKSTLKNDYIYPTVDEISRRPAGGIKRVAVAVQVDSTKVEEMAKVAGVEATEVQGQIKQAVEAAIGMDKGRNDQVIVNFMPFSQDDLSEEAVGTITATVLAHDSMPYLLVALALILAFVFVVRPLVASVTRPPPSQSEEEQLKEGELSEEEADELLAQRLQQLVENFVPVDALELSELVSHNPQAAAKVLKQWQKYG
ncbi:MAG: flagellar basal-body MS-ring/collar protein FliF [Myxococcota bacterium]